MLRVGRRQRHHEHARDVYTRLDGKGELSKALARCDACERRHKSMD